MIRTLAILALAVFAVTTTVSAQINKGFAFGLAVGGAEFEESQNPFVGGTVGFALQWKKVVFQSDLELDVVSGNNEDSPYYFDSSSDRCRDSRTGRFARSELCSNAEMYFAATVDGNYYFQNSSFYTGIGARIGSASTPYISLGYVLDRFDESSIHFRAFGWANLIGVSARFYLHSK